MPQEGLLHAAWELLTSSLRQVQGGEQADPGTPSVLTSVSAVLVSVLAILGSVAAGWLALWHVVLHRINFFRDLLGLNRKRQLESKKRANIEIQRIKKQLGRPL